MADPVTESENGTPAVRGTGTLERIARHRPASRVDWEGMSGQCEQCR